MRHKHEAGIERKWPCVREDNFWTETRISFILRDERYIGTVVYGRREAIEIGHLKSRPVAKEDWITREDRHEAIISKEDFNKVQAILAERLGRPYIPQSDRPLKRKVYCGVCGHAMRRCLHPRVQYRCSTHNLTGGFSCTGHGTDETDILDAILEAIRTYARLAVQLEKLNAVRQERAKREKKDVGKKLIALQNEKLRLDGQLQELYEKFVGSEISREAYLSQKSSMTGRGQEIAAEIQRLGQLAEESTHERSEAIARY